MDVTWFKKMDGVGLAAAIQNKEIKMREVLDASVHMLEKVNGELNAVARMRLEAVFAEVDRLDLDPGAGRFDGVPIFLKDLSQVVAGECNAGGSRVLQELAIPGASNITNAFQAAGCLPIGYSTTPEFGLKNITEARVYGATRNPWNVAHSPGGSSGGAAALVASGVVPIAGASDGGGSIRIPASFTGLFGLKPTRGRTAVGPGVGRQWQGAAIDFVLTRSVRDSARMLDHLQVIQEEAAFQTPLFDGSYEQMNRRANQPYRVGFCLDSPVGSPVSADAKKAVMKLVHWLEADGHLVEEAENGVDGVGLMRDYYMMNSGEISAMMTRLEKLLGRPIASDDVEMETWMMYIAGKNVTAAEFSTSLASWDVAAAKMATFHQTYDFYVTPATAFPAPKVGELTPDLKKETSYKAEIERLDAGEQQELIYDMFFPSLTYTPFTQLANLTGQPAMSVPLHVTSDGLPLGVQVMARKGAEHELFQLAYMLEESELWQVLSNIHAD